jgi:hypothetical protein
MYVLRVGFILACAAIIAAHSTSVQANEYFVDFNHLPSGDTCTVHHQAICDSHLIQPREHVEIGSYPECREQQCLKLTHDQFDGPTPAFRPCSELSQCQAAGFTDVWSVPDRMAGGDNKQFYLRFWVKFDASHGPDNFPPQYKAARVLTFDSDAPTILINSFPLNHPDGIGNLQFEYDNSRGQQNCYVSPVNWNEHVDEWLKIEWYFNVTTNQMKLWLTQENGNSLGSSVCGIDLEGLTMDRFAWVMGNVSWIALSQGHTTWPPGGGDDIRTIFVDDICVADSEEARNDPDRCLATTSSVIRPNPPGLEDQN